MKNNNSKLNVALLIVMFTIAGPVLAQAGTYWVSPTGTASWANCSGSTPLSGAAACSLSTANSSLTAGDLVYLRAGTYSTGIAPARSGTSHTARITYQGYPGETITITASTAISLSSRSYVTVTSVNSNGSYHALVIRNGSYNIVSYGNFGNYITTNWELNVIDTNSQYNWIHHNTFHDYGSCNTSDDGTILDVGNENTSNDTTQYNLLEDNIMYHGGHHVLGLETGYNTVRNNYLHNEGWQAGYGNRVVYMANQVGNTVAGHNVIEGNRFGFAAKTCEVKVTPSQATMGIVAMSTPYNIFRYNALYYASAYTLGTSAYAGTSGSNNRIYNNTMFDAGLNDKVSPTPIDTTTNSGEFAGIYFSSGSSNVVKNNLYSNTVAAHRGSTSSQTFATNYDGNTQASPQFVNANTDATVMDPFNSALPDLHLQSTSPARGTGGALTTTTNSGPGTTLTVADSNYFQDGTYAPSYAGVQADWIAVGTPANVVQIVSINRTSNTLTLASSISWTSGQSVWLYKNSSGVQVLYGSAPDAGAYPYTGAVTQVKKPLPPANVTVTAP